MSSCFKSATLIDRLKIRFISARKSKDLTGVVHLLVMWAEYMLGCHRYRSIMS